MNEYSHWSIKCSFCNDNREWTSLSQFLSHATQSHGYQAAPNAFEERRRVLEIVRKHIGFAALDEDVHEDMEIRFFRDLYARIDEEVNER